MKKTALIILFSSIILVFPGHVNAVTEEIIDPKCSGYLVTTPFEEDTGLPICTTLCRRECVDLGQSCRYSDGKPGGCFDLEGTIVDPVEERLNLMGADFGPPREAVPRLVRLALMAVFSLIGLVSIIIGLQVLVKRSTAGDNADAVEESAKTMRNAILGVVISFAGVFVVQVVALLIGLTGGLFDFQFAVSNATLTQSDLSQPCTVEGQRGIYTTLTRTSFYKCVDGSWQFESSSNV